MANERNKIFNEVTESAFYSLTPEEQENIDEMVYMLTKKIKNLGSKSAMELLAKIGVNQLNKGTELTGLLDKAEQIAVRKQNEKKNSVGKNATNYHKQR